MQRLSRLSPPRFMILLVAIVIFAAMYSFLFYLAILNHRLSRELVNHSWRDSTVISSAAGKNEREIVRVYGTDWRPDPAQIQRAGSLNIAS